jgi:hypothetical protein
VRFPRNNVVSVARYLSLGLEGETIHLEHEGWDLAESIKLALLDRNALLRGEGWRHWRLGLGDYTPGFILLAGPLADAYQTMMYEEQALAAVRHLSAMVKTVEAVVDPGVPMAGVESAGWDLSTLEHRVHATLPTFAPETARKLDELKLACDCLRKATELRLSFEARGFLLRIGLLSSYTLRQQIDRAVEVCFDLLKFGAQARAIETEYVAVGEPSSEEGKQGRLREVDSWRRYGSIVIENAFGREKARLAVFESVVQVALEAHQHKAGVIRFVASPRDAGE